MNKRAQALNNGFTVVSSTVIRIIKPLNDNQFKVETIYLIDNYKTNRTIGKDTAIGYFNNYPNKILTDKQCQL